MKKRLSLLLTLCLVLILAVPTSPVQAAVTYKLNAATRTLNGVGKKCTLTLTAPAKSTATWKSSNSSIATVTKAGVVTAKKKGTVTITCTVKKGSTTKRLSCKVTVKVPAKAIKFTNAVIDEEFDAQVLELGTTFDFNCKRISSSTKSASSDVIRFYVKDTTKATVNRKTGLVTPLKPGYTTLTVCCGATANKATAETNKVKQVINLYITKPSVSVKDCALANSHELDFTFNHEMNASTLVSGTALTSAVSIKPTSSASDPGKLSASLSEDKKTLVVTSTNAFDGIYDISINKVAQSSTGYALTPYAESKTLKDTVKPSYLGCTVDDTGLVVSLNFSEPISITDLLASDAKRADGKTLTYTMPLVTKSNYTLSKDKKSILLDLTSLAANDQNIPINITLYGIVDLVNNTTNPYPLVASIYTNTTSTSQAEIQNLYRNGNSVIAVFNKSIKTPGYMIANGVFESGVVNKANKKEVIYHLTDASLLNAKTALGVVLYNYSTYNANASTSTVQRMVNFGATASLPTITASNFTTKKVNSVSSNVLTLTYNSDITLLQKTGHLNGRSTLDGVVGANTLYTYTAAATGNTVTITFTDSFTELANYTFTIPEGFVEDSYFNNNASQSVSVTKLTGDSVALPAPTSIQVAGTYNQYVYVTFDTMLDQATSENKENYNISGLSIQSAQLVSNSYHSPAIVRLTFAANTIQSGAPYQVTISNIKGYKGSYTAMNTYKTMITLTNNKTLEYSSVQSLAANSTITIGFPTTLVSGTPTNIDYAITSGSTTYTTKSINVTGTTVTITLNQKLTAGKTLLLTPSTNNYLVDVNNQRLLNTPISVVIS